MTGEQMDETAGAHIALCIMYCTFRLQCIGCWEDISDIDHSLISHRAAIITLPPTTNRPVKYLQRYGRRTDGVMDYARLLGFITGQPTAACRG